ncbi:hypothetical protein GCM10011514_15060 [Emticicia aquatilis]|uniref:DUF2141 domain-containing protein n=1 Tax=Emticicia aquatilis TaxID=1537369 RepID=A0A916YMM6_9BACT|nr:DUF2141 domain-containing protein [Emticicia aquatilis]GGD51823.1 hypothetical protein GCM10011514_15060 [Emticicia aquatilis]
MKTLFKTIILIAIFAFTSTITFAQNKYSVTVTIKGIQQRTGKILATISNDENSFPQGGGIKSATAEVTKEGEVTLKFEGMLEGKYAIVLYQDLNGDNKLDMNGQMPAEPFGFSNVTMLMGPPNFEQCAFDLNENKNITISLFSF